MAHVSSDGEEHPNNTILTAGTITSPPQLPTLPFDVLPEILCRLPVKLLVQLRCLCKFFNSLISDPKFAKKHLQFSTKRHHLIVTSMINWDAYVHYDSPVPSLLSTSIITQTQLYPPNSITNGRNFVNLLCSCDGIFCGMLKPGSYFLWNPSIQKFKLLPPLENSLKGGLVGISFGYDHFIDNYKVIVVSSKIEVFVNTLGTDHWRRIEDIPYDHCIFRSGIFLSGTINWLASDDSSILSLDLEKESYHQLLLPNYEIQNVKWTLGVVRGCLCVFARNDMFFDVWIMKKYGNQESWTKLYSVPNMQDRGLEPYTVSYISEDDHLLIGFVDTRSRNRKLVVYDSKTDTLNIPEFENNYDPIYSYVYIESLISP